MSQIPSADRDPAPRLSRHDPPPDGRRGRPPVIVVAFIVIVIFVLVILHLTGVVGPGS